MKHEAFRSGDFSTHFVANHFDPDVLSDTDADLDEAIAVAAALFAHARHVQEAAPAQTAGQSNWRKNRMELR